MSRLIAFGCSYTYGLGLPDCYKIISFPIKEFTLPPSQNAWPSILATKINYDILNLSKVGSGNKEIVNNIINTEFNTNDLVIIMWSHFTRFDFFRCGKIKNYRVDHSDPKYKEFVEHFMDMRKSDWKYDNAHANFFAIQFAHMWLSEKNIKYYSILSVEDFSSFDYPNFFDQSRTISIPLKEIYIDKAEDNMHFGLESHKLLAQKIYDKITA